MNICLTVLLSQLNVGGEAVEHKTMNILCSRMLLLHEHWPASRACHSYKQGFAFTPISLLYFQSMLISMNKAQVVAERKPLSPSGNDEI